MPRVKHKKRSNLDKNDPARRASARRFARARRKAEARTDSGKPKRKRDNKPRNRHWFYQ